LLCVVRRVVCRAADSRLWLSSSFRDRALVVFVVSGQSLPYFWLHGHAFLNATTCREQVAGAL
jgi:tRNA pseudouridine-54 N-methylase